MNQEPCHCGCCNGASEEDIFKDVLNSAQAEVDALNHQKGWRQQERSVGDECTLLHSEVSEIFDGYRDTGIVPKDELADVLIRLMDFANRYDIKLADEFLAKMEKNWERDYRHGGKTI